MPAEKNPPTPAADQPAPAEAAPAKPTRVRFATENHTVRFVLPDPKHGDLVFDHTGTDIPVGDADRVWDTANQAGVHLIELPTEKD